MATRSLYIIIIVLIGSAPSFSQPMQNWCGTIGEYQQALVERLERNKAALHNSPVAFRDIQYVPITFHLIAKSDGSGMVPKQRVLDQLCLLNEDYADLNIQFYLRDGFNYLLNDELYENHSANTTLLNLSTDDQAINIFLPQDADPPNQVGQGVVLGYYSPAQDWLVIDKDEIGKDGLTFTHEMGHYFSLLHPFSGWEPEPWDLGTHGAEVELVVAPDGQTLVELANGNNCNSAGDRVCDTPADYLFGFGWDNCNFNQSVFDRSGTPLNPDEKLWMNYFFNCDEDDYYYTDMQQQLILQDLESDRRAHLRNGTTPSTTPITETPEGIAPINDEKINIYNAVNISWSEVPGASNYLLQIARLPTFSTPVVIYDEVINGTSHTIEILEPNIKYFWRVRPFSAYRTCTDFSGVYSFDTGEDATTQSNDLVTAFIVEQNPVENRSNINVFVQATEAFTGKLSLYNMAGQEVSTFGDRDFQLGENRLQLMPGSLPNGIYLLVFDTSAGLMTRKILIKS